MPRSSKSFNICVVLDILDVTCPGVCICPKGMVYLDIWLFGCSSNTSYVQPKFPLAFNETFSFHETFAELVNLKDVQKALEERCVRITLVQVYEKKQITLATYKNNVDDVLYPERNRLSRKGEISVFMKKEPLFPGTISPKITLVTKTSVTEEITCATDDRCWRRPNTRRQPNTMKRVHHNKFTNSLRPFRTEGQRISPIETGGATTDSDTDGQPYCRRWITKAADCAIVDDRERRANETCEYCEDVDGLNVRNKSSRRIPSEPKNKSSDNNVIGANNFGKNVKATLEVDGRRHECRESKSDRCDGANESIKSRRNICREVNKTDTVGDAIKYYTSSRNHYKRLYDSATYQLSRNLKLL